jgi:hypothetical protein
VASVIPDTSNPVFNIAVQLVNQSARSIFLTGKAGTGKTTFLKYIRENCPKQMAVVAPTGVAAINAGGVTIHSFFQLPFAPFVPETTARPEQPLPGNREEVVSRHSLLSRLRITGEKIKVLQQLELLVIDEVSMVRCDTIDAIDTVLRHIRKRPLDRFGGVQVLFIGDMFQLPPVIKEPEWKFLSPFYDSPYFFDSRAIREEPPVYIEFTKIYRQSDEVFIGLLNQVRNNELDPGAMEILEKQFQPSFRRHKRDGYIVLTTHNEKARQINTRELENLQGQVFSYKAEIKDEFPATAYPADEVLYLKTGAQVMFIKNDSDRSKRYFNGKIGVVTKLEKDTIVVQCENDPEEIEVNPEKWENIRYVINKTSRAMEAEVLGSFTQYPLRLAWAITIHKSQGLTFERAIIDAGEAFAPGQVYVALSRCTNLEGMILQSRVRPGSLFTDDRIVRFSQNCVLPEQLQRELAVAKRNYQEKLLLATFDFTPAVHAAGELRDYVSEHASSFNSETIPWTDEVLEKLQRLQATALKFHSWLQFQLRQPVLPEENILLQTKTKDGAGHFIKEIRAIQELLQQSPAVTDSSLHAKEFNESVKELFAGLALKAFLLKEAGEKFDVEAWHRKKKSFVLPAFSVNAYAGAAQQRVQSPHPLLHQQLRKLRDAICAKKNIAIYLVAGSKTLDEMATWLPQTPEELEQVSGFGTVKVETYGQQFLDIIISYCKEHGLESRISEKSPKHARKETRAPKKDTKAESFRLFKEGRSVSDIATARNLTVQTIEGHLAYYVRKGEIDIEELVSREKIVLIEPAIRDIAGGSIVPVKEKLGNAVGFGEIRLVMAWSAFKNGDQHPGIPGEEQ